MKKTLVALAVAATAATAVSTANAATVYEQDGTKLELSGSLRLFLGRLGDHERGDLRNDGSRLFVKGSHDLGNGLSAFATLQLRFDDRNGAEKTSNTFGNPTTKHLFAGLKHKDIGAVSFGRQATNADDVVADNGYINSGALNPLMTDADKSVKFRSEEFAGFSFGADYFFGGSSKGRVAALAAVPEPDQDDTTAYPQGANDPAYKLAKDAYDKYAANIAPSLKNGYSASLFYNVKVAEQQKLDFAVVYSQENYDAAYTTNSVYKDKTWVAHLGYTLGDEDQQGEFNVNGSYGQYKKESEGVKGRYSILQASYQVLEPSKVYVQWERTGEKDITSGDRTKTHNRYLGGVDYKLHTNVLTYFEYAHDRVKDHAKNETKKDNVFGVGLRVFF
ncbi:porin [Lonepinella sp. BR2271]|uniref:porin n=1 Tax=Lonepinella sp. BR2271 TaxID=3434550 RepID=UPI003F6DF06F